MKPCPCGTIPTTSSDLSYSVVWCPACHKTLTKEYSKIEDAVLAWNHGVEVLPPCCPFCSWPPLVIDAEGPTPQVMCEMPCPLRGRIFTLEEWNMSRPKPYRLNELMARWTKKGKNVTLKALKKTIEDHVRNRLRGD